MNSKIKSGFYVGIAITVFFLSKSIIAWITGEEETFNEIIKSIIASLAAGLISGLLFGWLADKFVVGNIFKKLANFNTTPDETVIFKTSANHNTDAETIGGTLCLTNKRFIFKSYNYNVDNHELSINLRDIVRVEKFKTFSLVNNGLVITTIRLGTETFVVDQQKRWLEIIDLTKTAYNNA